MKKPSKLIRMLKAAPFEFCNTGLKLAKRKYGSLTLQQAWKKAEAEHMREVLQACNVAAPVRCNVNGSRGCWMCAKDVPADELRAKFKGIPAKLQKLYARA